MRYMTFLKTGVEVLHLGMQHAESNAWPIEHWRANKGRWRLYTPAIDSYINEALAGKSFGEGVDDFVLFLEVADFASWGGPPAFHPPGGSVKYKHGRKELWSVAQLDWLKVQTLTPTEQLHEYRLATIEAINRVSMASRKPKSFAITEFASEVDKILSNAKVSTLTRSAHRS